MSRRFRMSNGKSNDNDWIPLLYSDWQFPAKVLTELLYPVAIEKMRFLGNGGGLSGARIWQMTGQRGSFCLREWPQPYPDSDKLREIHRCQIWARKKGLEFVPAVVIIGSGEMAHLAAKDPPTFVMAEGHFWELTEWLPGLANYWESPSQERLKASAKALANLHLVWRELTRSLSSLTVPAKVQGDQVPAIADRCAKLRNLNVQVVVEMQEKLERFNEMPWYMPAKEILRQIDGLKPTLYSALAYWHKYTFPCQYVLRDVWHDHVLFRGDHCTGLIDYGSLRVDTVATDLVRMLGSLTKSDPDSDWDIAVEAYQEVAELEEVELAILRDLYESSVVLSGIQWIQWLAVEGKAFPGKNEFVNHRIAELSAASQLVAARRRSFGGSFGVP